MLAELPEARTDEIDSFLGECDAWSYAPAGEQRAAPIPEEFHARALALGRTVREQAR
jgi:hypothetical protein